MNSSDKKICVRHSVAGSIAVVTAFIAFALVFFALIIISPKGGGEWSGNERRKLAEAPDWSVSSILSGDVCAQIESWLKDHFPGRSAFVALYSYANRYTGRNATESIVLGKNGRLFSEPAKDDAALIASNARIISDFVVKNNMTAYAALIPSSGYMLQGEQPALHREYIDDAIAKSIERGLSGFDCLDTESALIASGDVANAYYRTDHHLTMDGIYSVYLALSEKLGFTPISASEFTKTAYEFYGTSYGGSGLWYTKPDLLEIWLNEGNSNISVTTVDGSRTQQHTGMFDFEALKPGVTDKYEAYLYGNHGYTRVVNPNVQDGALLVLKDSYGNALVPLLAEHYHEIIMIDIRYYNSGMTTPGEIAAENNITDFLLIYGINTFVSTSYMAWLR